MRLAVALCVLAALALPAQATEWLYCNDETQTVTLGLLMGGADVPSIAGITLSHEETVWASHTAYGPGEDITLGQSFGDDSRLDADFLDGDGALLGELRLVRADEGNSFVYGGTLRIVGLGAWAVGCPGV